DRDVDAGDAGSADQRPRQVHAELTAMAPVDEHPEPRRVVPLGVHASGPLRRIGGGAYDRSTLPQESHTRPAQHAASPPPSSPVAPATGKCSTVGNGS